MRAIIRLLGGWQVGIPLGAAFILQELGMSSDLAMAVFLCGYFCCTLFAIYLERDKGRGAE